MRLLPTSLLMGLLLVGVGCSKTLPPSPTEPTPQPAPVARESENLAGDLEVTTVTIDKSFVLNDAASCTLHIEYPGFADNALPQELAFETNHVIAHFVADALNDTGDIDNPSQLDAVADTYQTACKQEIQDEYAQFQDQGDDLFTDLQHNVSIVYNVTLNQSGLLSVGLDEDSYTGGAHSNQRIAYLNLDLTDDRLLTLGDLLKPEDLKVFLQYEKAQLLADNRDNLYPDAATGYDQLIADTTPMTAEDQLAAYGNTENFYLTPTSIVTYYNTYDIAPYSSGPLYVEIPYSAIKEYLLPDGPLNRL